MTRYLKEEKNCSIDIVELVPEYHEIAKQYANKSFCGSIESDDWQSALRGQSYDYITFADVLEHLIDPWEMLQKIEEFLKPNGKVLISYPNICHNDIIKGMFIDNFKYDKIGLRDKTHLRFFGLSDLKDLFKKSSLQIEHLDFTHTKTTEINKDLKIPFLLKYLLKRRKYGDVFQFIIKAGKQN